MNHVGCHPLDLPRKPCGCEWAYCPTEGRIIHTAYCSTHCVAAIHRMAAYLARDLSTAVQVQSAAGH